MNFDFSDEQKAIQDQARRVLSRECPPEKIRAIIENRAPYDPALWATNC